MFGLLFLAFLVVPIAELYLFIQVADSIGFLSTVFWIVAVSVIGAWLVTREGMSALRRANREVVEGRIPTNELINGILILFAGALMLTPGFLTDTFGLTLLFPPTRALYRGWLRSRLSAGPIVVGRSDVFRMTMWDETGDVYDVQSWEDPPDGPPRPMIE